MEAKTERAGTSDLSSSSEEELVESLKMIDESMEASETAEELKKKPYCAELTT